MPSTRNQTIETYRPIPSGLGIESANSVKAQIQLSEHLCHSVKAQIHLSEHLDQFRQGLELNYPNISAHSHKAQNQTIATSRPIPSSQGTTYRNISNSSKARNQTRNISYNSVKPHNKTIATSGVNFGVKVQIQLSEHLGQFRNGPDSTIATSRVNFVKARDQNISTSQTPNSSHARNPSRLGIKLSQHIGQFSQGS